MCVCVREILHHAGVREKKATEYLLSSYQSTANNSKWKITIKKRRGKNSMLEMWLYLVPNQIEKYRFPLLYTYTFASGAEENIGRFIQYNRLARLVANTQRELAFIRCTPWRIIKDIHKALSNKLNVSSVARPSQMRNSLNPFASRIATENDRTNQLNSYRFTKDQKIYKCSTIEA